MKNIVKKFLILFISLSIIFNITLVSNATDDDIQAINSEDQVDEEEINSSDDISFDTDDQQDSLTATDSQTDVIEEDQIEKNFYYLGSDNINITDYIYGDVYILTSGEVTINSTIEGNVFILAKKVELKEDSEIDSSLYCIADNLTIDGIVINNTYAISQKFYLNEYGNLYRDLFLIAENIDFSGGVDRDANVLGTNIIFSQYATINRDFNYSSEKEITIPEDVIMGQVNYNKITPSSNEKSNTVSSIIFNILSYIIFVIVLFIILKWLNNKIISNSEILIPNILKYILYGILGLVITPIVSILLLILGLTANLALLLLAIYIIVMLLASSILIINLSNLIVMKFGAEQNTMKNVLCIVILCLIYKLLQLVPIISTLITFVSIIIGLGIILKTIIPLKNTDANNIQ